MSGAYGKCLWMIHLVVRAEYRKATEGKIGSDMRISLLVLGPIRCATHGFRAMAWFRTTTAFAPRSLMSDLLAKGISLSSREASSGLVTTARIV
jgi:hypothetical protein